MSSWQTSVSAAKRFLGATTVIMCFNKTLVAVHQGGMSSPGGIFDGPVTLIKSK